MRKEQKGAITVEATISLTAFLFLFMMLFSIITLCRAQAIIASALNNTAKEISQYTYLYSLTGIHNSIEAATETVQKESFDAFTENINDSFNAMQGLNDDVQTSVNTGVDDLASLMDRWSDISTTIPNDVEAVGDSLSSVQDSIEEMARDPKSLLMGLGKIAASDGLSMVKSKVITPPICRSLIKKHLEDRKEGDTEEFLRRLCVVPIASGSGQSYLKALDFTDSSLFATDKYDIVLRVRYNLKVLPFLPIDLQATICQSAATRGWADGDGRHVTSDGDVIESSPIDTDD